MHQDAERERIYEASTTQNQNTTRFIIRYRKRASIPDMRINIITDILILKPSLMTDENE
ncbi:head-tail adaptor protein [Paenibacillus larvae]|nr:head-tail adaptor protein [Paenibacillus larvae]MDT2194852.1 head-tail adaptor protein [Paenibacillus larvae]